MNRPLSSDNCRETPPCRGRRQTERRRAPRDRVRSSIHSEGRAMLARLRPICRVTVPALIGLALLAGCAGRVSMLPNADKNLRKTPAQFAADAATRHPFKAELPSGGEAI